MSGAGPVESAISTLKFLLWILATAVPVFLGLFYYWSLDRKTNNFDEQCREGLQENSVFKGIRRGARPNLIATSDSKTSKVTTSVKKLRGKISDRPYKIVPVDDRSFDERKKEVIFERCKEVPGKTIIDSDLLAAIRNYYAYQLALDVEGSDSDVTQHFRSKLEEYDDSDRVLELGRKDKFDDVSLCDDDKRRELEPLTDVYLRILEGVERHCIQSIDDLQEKEKEVERCREFMMETFWGLYSENIKGVEVSNGLRNETAVNLIRTDVRDNDNIGYWLLMEGDSGIDDLGRFLNVGYGVKGVLDEYWGDGNYSELYPDADSIPDVDVSERPFFLFSKDLDEFGGGPLRYRVKQDPTYRRREDIVETPADSD